MDTLQMAAFAALGLLALFAAPAFVDHRHERRSLVTSPGQRFGPMTASRTTADALAGDGTDDLVDETDAVAAAADALREGRAAEQAAAGHEPAPDRTGEPIDERADGVDEGTDEGIDAEELAEHDRMEYPPDETDEV